MAESSFRSKHAGKPGSLVAIRVDYPLSSNAFEPLTQGSWLQKRNEEVNKFIRGPRIGDKTDWNSSTATPGMGPLPIRQNMRQNSEFQAVKMNYNYRAAVLPTVNHDTTFVPKPNKMQVDRSLFLSPSEKKNLVKTCPGTSAALSRAEIGNGPVPGVELESGWNVSTALEEKRANIFKKVDYESHVESNKRKTILNPATYITPVDRVASISATNRSLKLTQRGGSVSAPVSGLAGLTGTVNPAAPAVFKMSNMAQWWSLNPVNLPSVGNDESAIEKMSDGQ
jgi:hypothetical protein